MKLEDIASELDVAISTVQRWEKQTMSIPSERLPAIALAYGCRINDIFVDPRDPPEVPPEVANIFARMSEASKAHAIRVLNTFAADDGSRVEGGAERA